MKYALFLLLFASVPLQAKAAPALADQTLAICDDINEWPPYTYYQREHGVKTGKLVGYSIDVLDEILTAHGIKYQVTLLPWARCLSSVTVGTQALAINVVRNRPRERSFLLTANYYTVRNFYFYSRKHFPNGLPITKLTDLGKYRVCGILNYDHTNMGLKPGQVDQGSRTFDALIGKLHLGRCTLFASQFEAMQGYALIGQPYFDDPDLGYAQIPGAPMAHFAFAVSRATPYGAELQGLLSRDINAMQANGRLDAIWKKHQLIK